MKHAISRDLHRYWDGLRAGRSAPERSDIDPAAIRHILPSTFILEVVGRGSADRTEASFRLAGTRLNALFGRDLKGMTFDRLWGARNAVMVRSLIDGVLDERTPVVASAYGAPSGCPAAALELLLLPLRHQGRTHSRILGSLAAHETPSWIGLWPSEPLDLLSFRTLRSGSSGFDCGVPVAPRIDRRDLRQAPPASTPTILATRGRFRVYAGGRLDETARPRS